MRAIFLLCSLLWWSGQLVVGIIEQSDLDYCRSKNFKVASYDVWGESGHWDYRVTQIVEAVKKASPDVINFQSVYDETRRAGKKQSADLTSMLQTVYPFASKFFPVASVKYPGSGKQAEDGLLTLSKYPIVDQQSKIFLMEHGGLVAVDVKIPDSRCGSLVVRTINTNFHDAEYELYGQSMEWNFQQIGKRDLTVLTFTHDSDHNAKSFLERYKYNDAWLLYAQGHGLTEEDGLTYPYWSPKERRDSAWIRPTKAMDISIKDFEFYKYEDTLSRHPSNHKMIILQLSMTLTDELMTTMMEEMTAKATKKKEMQDTYEDRQSLIRDASRKRNMKKTMRDIDKASEMEGRRSTDTLSAEESSNTGGAYGVDSANGSGAQQQKGNLNIQKPAAMSGSQGNFGIEDAKLQREMDREREQAKLRDNINRDESANANANTYSYGENGETSGSWFWYVVVLFLVVGALVAFCMLKKSGKGSQLGSLDSKKYDSYSSDSGGGGGFADSFGGGVHQRGMGAYSSSPRQMSGGGQSTFPTPTTGGYSGSGGGSTLQRRGAGAPIGGVDGWA